MRPTLRALLAVLVLLLLGAAGGCSDVDAHTIAVWHAYRGDEEKAIQRLARDYEKAHPGVRVELLALPFDAYQSKLKAAIPHGHGPDLFIEAHERSHVYQHHKLLAPIPFAMDDDYDPVVAAAVTQDGVRIAIPLSAKCVALYVRADRAGPPPRSMEELLATPVPAGVFPLAYEANNAYLHAAILSAYGGTLVDGAQFSFDSSAGISSMRFVHDAMAQKKIPEEPTGALVTQLFGSGKAVAIIDGPWLRADLPKDLAYEVVPLPTLEGHRMRPLLTVEAAFLTPQGVTRPDALDFARFLGSREAAITLATVGHQVVARRAAWTDPALTSDKALVAFHEAVRDAIPTPASEAMNAAWVPANDALHNVLRGQAPQATLMEAHRRFDDAMKPPPPARSPGTLYLALGLAGLGLAFLGVKRARQPGFRTELKASLPAYRYVL
ncbi:MAG TPA: extracellular solute-binding protein, partial [Polyangiaceae bacterium]